MKEVYDDGYYMLGQVKYIIEQFNSSDFAYSSDEEETVYDIIKELKEDYDEEDIVVIYYDNPMGYDIKRFTKRDICYVGKKED